MEKQKIESDTLIEFLKTLDSPYRIEWKVKVGSFVSKGRILGIILINGKKKFIISHKTGIVSALPVAEKEFAQVEIQDCPHDTVIESICINCGSEVSTKNHKAFLISGSRILISKEKEKQVAEDYKEKLLSDKKLSLILDIDHTLVHTTVTTGPFPEKQDDLYSIPDRNGFSHSVKFRPYLKKFFEKIALYYEVFLYSHGIYEYVQSISKLIDPEYKFLSEERIIGRNMKNPMEPKYLRKIFPGDKKRAVIIDDRSDVWVDKENLVLIYPFVFFSDLPSVSYDRVTYGQLNANSDESSLLYMISLLRNMQALYYDAREICHESVDVAEIIRLLRLHILSGTKICISKLGKDVQEIKHLSRIARSIGAELQEEAEGALVLLHEFQPLSGKLAHVDWLLFSSRYWHMLPTEPFELSATYPKGKFSESKMAQNLEQEIYENWKRPNYSEILSILKSNIEARKVPEIKKKKIE